MTSLARIQSSRFAKTDDAIAVSGMLTLLKTLSFLVSHSDQAIRMTSESKALRRGLDTALRARGTLSGDGRSFHRFADIARTVHHCSGHDDEGAQMSNIVLARRAKERTYTFTRRLGLPQRRSSCDCCYIL
jgi:hypothetical protein